MNVPEMKHDPCYKEMFTAEYCSFCCYIWKYKFV